MRPKKIMTKHSRFGAPKLSQSKKITHPLVAMVETFRMSDTELSEQTDLTEWTEYTK